MAQPMPFVDAAEYERYMARWSVGVGAPFLDWVAPPSGARWLDIGCGTGIFTRLVLERCAPASVVAVDPSVEQIRFALKEAGARRADYRVADAQALPFENAEFDVVASALVINFIPDRRRGVAEMRRVGRPGGVVAGYVWDFAGNRAPLALLGAGLREIGAHPPVAPGAEDSRLEALEALFAGAGLASVATRPFDVTVSFADFDEYWNSSTPKSRPVGKMVAQLPEADRRRLMEVLRARLATGPDGRVSYSARAHAVKGHVPL